MPKEEGKIFLANGAVIPISEYVGREERKDIVENFMLGAKHFIRGRDPADYLPLNKRRNIMTTKHYKIFKTLLLNPGTHYSCKEMALSIKADPRKMSGPFSQIRKFHRYIQ